jgi:hypothetical protein
MSDQPPVETKTLPTPAEIAGKIAIAAHNAGQPILLDDAGWREVSERDKLREGLKQSVRDELTALGCPITKQGAADIVRPPAEETLTFAQAQALSAEAQEDGARSIPGGVSSDVLYDRVPVGKGHTNGD